MNKPLSQHTRLDVLVIGAGQAALALGHHLRGSSLRFRLLERNLRVGDSWRRRYDSLTLFTPRAYSALPGLAVPGDPDGCPTKDEIADYLEAYAEHFDLPVSLGTGVRLLERTGDGYRAVTDAGEVLHARAVVIATGAFQEPAIPAVARGLAPDVLTLTAESYENPAQVRAGARVLVVGDGATGRQIASELSPGREVLLATGHPRKVSPTRFLGRSIFWWLDKTGSLSAPRDSWVGRMMRRADSFPSDTLRFDQLRARGIRVVPRLEATDGRTVTLAGGERVDVDVVVFATGYRDRSGWVHEAEVKDERGNFVEDRGVSPSPGLFFLGRSWQRSRGSALLHGVGADAAWLLERLEEHLAATRPASTPKRACCRDAGRELAASV